jgi:SAM-dependent methyltransferase
MMSKIPSIRDIQEAVHKKYAEVANTAEGKFTYPTGRRGAEMLGYDLTVMKIIPDDILQSFCGVGNPFALEPIHLGDSVLDVGCGTGFDLINAGHLVGPAGKVCGIDLTPEMVKKARENLARVEMLHAEVKLAGSDSIPYHSNTFDVTISNGVLNLSPLKEKSFQEIHRVLKPHGRLQFADIVLKEELPHDISKSPEAWSD